MKYSKLVYDMHWHCCNQGAAGFFSRLRGLHNSDSSDHSSSVVSSPFLVSPPSVKEVLVEEPPSSVSFKCVSFPNKSQQWWWGSFNRLNTHSCLWLLFGMSSQSMVYVHYRAKHYNVSKPCVVFPVHKIINSLLLCTSIFLSSLINLAVVADLYA